MRRPNGPDPHKCSSRQRGAALTVAGRVMKDTELLFLILRILCIKCSSRQRGAALTVPLSLSLSLSRSLSLSIYLSLSLPRSPSLSLCVAAAPTEIQRETIRVGMREGRDVVGIAETGDAPSPPRRSKNKSQR